MKPVVLLDTNVWVSAFLNKQGHPAHLIQAWHDDASEVIIALPILEEIGEALRRPRIKKKYRIQADEIAQYLELITAGAAFVSACVAVFVVAAAAGATGAAAGGGATA